MLRWKRKHDDLFGIKCDTDIIFRNNVADMLEDYYKKSNHSPEEKWRALTKDKLKREKGNDKIPHIK